MVGWSWEASAASPPQRESRIRRHCRPTWRPSTFAAPWPPSSFDLKMHWIAATVVWNRRRCFPGFDSIELEVDIRRWGGLFICRITFRPLPCCCCCCCCSGPCCSGGGAAHFEMGPRLLKDERHCNAQCTMGKSWKMNNVHWTSLYNTQSNKGFIVTAYWTGRLVHTQYTHFVYSSLN